MSNPDDLVKKIKEQQVELEAWYRLYKLKLGDVKVARVVINDCISFCIDAIADGRFLDTLKKDKIAYIIYFSDVLNNIETGVKNMDNIKWDILGRYPHVSLEILRKLEDQYRR